MAFYGGAACTVPNGFIAAPSAVGMREDELIRALAAAAGLEQKEGVAALTKVMFSEFG